MTMAGCCQPTPPPPIIENDSSNLGSRVSLLSWGAGFSWRTLGGKWGCCDARRDCSVDGSVRLTRGSWEWTDTWTDGHGVGGQNTYHISFGSWSAINSNYTLGEERV